MHKHVFVSVGVNNPHKLPLLYDVEWRLFEMTLNCWVIVEKYPFPNEVVSGSILST